MLPNEMGELGGDGEQKKHVIDVADVDDDAWEV